MEGRKTRDAAASTVQDSSVALLKLKNIRSQKAALQKSRPQSAMMHKFHETSNSIFEAVVGPNENPYATTTG